MVREDAIYVVKFKAYSKLSQLWSVLNYFPKKENIENKQRTQNKTQPTNQAKPQPLNLSNILKALLQSALLFHMHISLMSMLLFFKNVFILYVFCLNVCMCVCVPPVCLVLMEVQRGIKYIGSGITRDYETACGY